MDTELLTLCLIIFFVRIFDVCLGTVRMIMVVRGKTLLGAIIGFVEVAIWFIVIKDALTSDHDSLWIAFAFAGGFSIGTYIGGAIAKRIVKGKLNIQIIIEKEKKGLVRVLRDLGYAVSVVDAKGYEYSDKLLLILGINSNKLEELEAAVKEYDETAFMVVNEVKQIENGYFPGSSK